MKTRKPDLSSLPSIIMVPSTGRTAEKKRTHQPGRRQTGSRLTSEQQELVHIKKTLGLRHQDFAVMLDIGLPRLSSYIYGKTASVPPEIMETARKLLNENHKMSRQIREKFSRPMSEILDEWTKKLGTSSDAQLASLLGVVSMTIARWKKDETRPDLSALNRYDRIVELIIKNIRVGK